MSDFKINSIATKQGQHGPIIAGVSTVNSTGCMKIPSGKTVNRLISEEVVTDGLVGYYDAGNTNSYSGSGTTWNDLSNNTNHATISGSTFNASNGGYFANDGSNDLITVPYQQNPMRVNQYFSHLQLTYDLFVRFPTDSGGNFMGVSVSGGHGSGGLFFGSNSSSPFNGLSEVATSKTITFIFTPGDPNSDTNLGAHFNSNPEGEWVHIVVSLDLTGKNGLTNSEFYQNGNKLDKKFKNKGTNSFSPTTSYNQNQVDNLAGGRYVNSQNYEQYDVAIIKLYNRVLTQDEVQRNFTAHRGRFSI